jgi:FixJ family two-component response regulator
MNVSDETTQTGTVFVIDDEEDVRRSLMRLVRSAGWTGEAFASAQPFMERLPFEGIGCILLDIELPGMSGPELQDRIGAMGVTLPIVFLTGHGDVPSSVHAMKHGAVDFLQKPAEDVIVLGAIDAAMARHATLSARHQERRAIEGRLAKLSVRERQVMEFVVRGRLNKQIAAELGITEKTVKAHRARVMEKLGVRSVAALVQMCAAAGVVLGEHAS